jgi:hypothetical protein
MRSRTTSRDFKMLLGKRPPVDSPGITIYSEKQIYVSQLIKMNIYFYC